MAWTTPRTWVAGEIVTAAVGNTHWRDNFNAILSAANTLNSVVVNASLASNVSTGNLALDVGSGIVVIRSGVEAMRVEEYSADAVGGVARFQKSRHATLGSQTIVQNNDNIANIIANASDGVGFIEAARIDVQVDGTPGVNDMPGRIMFLTTPDGGSASVERWRITESGILRAAGAQSIATASGDLTLAPGSSSVSVTADIIPSTDNTYDLGSSAAGWRHIWHSPDRAAAYLTSQLDIVTGTWTAVPLAAEYFDPHGLHDIASSNTKMKIAVDGTYLVSAHVRWLPTTANVTDYRSFIWLNSSIAEPIIGQRNWVVSPFDSLQQDITGLLDLVNGDVIELQVLQNSGNSTARIDAPDTNLQIIRLSD